MSKQADCILDLATRDLDNTIQMIMERYNIGAPFMCMVVERSLAQLQQQKLKIYADLVLTLEKERDELKAKYEPISETTSK